MESLTDTTPSTLLSADLIVSANFMTFWLSSEIRPIFRSDLIGPTFRSTMARSIRLSFAL